MRLNHCKKFIKQVAIIGVVDPESSGRMKGVVMYWNMDEAKQYRMEKEEEEFHE